MLKRQLTFPAVKFRFQTAVVKQLIFN